MLSIRNSLWIIWATNLLKNIKIYRNKNTTLRRKAFALMHSRYIDFPISVHDVKKYASSSFFSDIAAVFLDSYKGIHYSHVTRKIHGYAHNFCNQKVRELTKNSAQYFSCIFHNGFRFDMTFLTKDLWLSLWQTKDVTLLGSGLTSLKAYNIGRHIKFVGSIKYYQQPPKLARSTDVSEKARIKSLFLNYL